MNVYNRAMLDGLEKHDPNRVFFLFAVLFAHYGGKRIIQRYAGL
jgi:hypothetical protein